MSATNLQNLIRLELQKRGIITFRNNTGALRDKNGRLVRYGLVNGSSDIIGIMPGGVFLAIEVKYGRDTVKENQLSFIDAVKKQGGIAGIARSVEDAIKIIEGSHDNQ